MYCIYIHMHVDGVHAILQVKYIGKLVNIDHLEEEVKRLVWDDVFLGRQETSPLFGLCTVIQNDC